jgi:hypothetical protein
VNRRGENFEFMSAGDKSFWVPDSSVGGCSRCSQQFTLTRRRHHCRKCGAVVCNRCSLGRANVPEHGWHTPVRCCDKCVRDAERSLLRRHSSDAVPARATKIIYDSFIPTLSSSVPPDLADKHYWWPHVNRASAEAALASQAPGVALIRPGSSHTPFVVSCRKEDGFRHYALELADGGGFELEVGNQVRRFATAAEVVSHLGLTLIGAAATDAAVAAATAVVVAPAGDDEEQLQRRDVRATMLHLNALGFDSRSASRALLVNSGDVKRAFESLVQSRSTENFSTANARPDDDEDDTSEE